MKKHRVLFICHGNICRSPMAEFIFKALVKAYGVEDLFYAESAAVSTEEIGNGIYPPARRCLTNHGVAFDPDKKSRQVTRADYDNFDDLIVMDSSNLRLIQRIIPDDPQHKIKRLMTFTGHSRDVADPWYTGDFEATWQDCLAGCEAYISTILHIDKK